MMIYCNLIAFIWLDPDKTTIPASKLRGIIQDKLCKWSSKEHKGDTMCAHPKLNERTWENESEPRLYPAKGDTDKWFCHKEQSGDENELFRLTVAYVRADENKTMWWGTIFLTLPLCFHLLLAISGESCLSPPSVKEKKKVQMVNCCDILKFEAQILSVFLMAWLCLPNTSGEFLSLQTWSIKIINPNLSVCCVAWSCDQHCHNVC